MTLFRNTFSHIRDFSSTLWIAISASLLNQLGNMAFVFLVLYLTKHFNFSLAKASFAFAAVCFSMLISGLCAGGFIDRLGSARMMIASLFLNGTILAIFPLIHNYFSIVLMCLLWGLSFGLYRPASQTFISHLSKPGMHKITFSIYRLAINLGMSIGPAMGGYLAYHSFGLIFLVNGLANLIAGSILLLGIGRSEWFNYRPARQNKLELSTRWLKRDPALRLFVLGMIPVSMIFYQHESTLPVFLNLDLHLPLSFYGLLFTLNTLLIVFFELPLNVATLSWSYRVNFILGTLFNIVGFAGLYFATQAWHVVVLTIIWTIGEMILFPAASSYIADIAPENVRGSYMALFSTSSNLALLLGPWGGAIVMGWLGASGLWIVCGLWGCLSVFIFYFVRDVKNIPKQLA